MVDTYVLDLLKRGYKGTGDENGRHNDPNLHVSDLLNLCPRAYALCGAQGKSFRKFLPVGMSLGYIFDMGHKIQDIFIDRFARTGMLFGTWECTNCGNRDVDFQREKWFCLKCDCKGNRYVDTRIEIVYKGIKIVGSLDTMLRANETKRIIFPNECKSIKKDGDDGFDKLEAPLLSHRAQVSYYIWILRTKGVKMPDKLPGVKVSIAKNTATISYAVKGNAKEPFKVFQVPPDEGMITTMVGKLDDIVKFKKTKKIPKKICNSQANMMARDCPARSTCFKEGF